MSDQPSDKRRPDFAALLQRVCEGSEDAAREFLKTFGPPILHIVRRKLHKRLRSKYDAVDFEQAVWASFFAQDLHAYKFDGPDALVSYLLTLARNKVVDAIRQRRTGKYDIDREHSLESSTVRDGPELTARAPTPSQVAVAQEEWDRLLEGQPEHYRQILRLRQQGYTFEEIATEIGMSKSGVVRVLEKLDPRWLP